MNYQYTYDEVGNIMTKTTEHGTYGYGYGTMSRLTGVDNPMLDDESYTYDAVGNRLTSADVSGSWSYNQNNELLGFADGEYDYDENGNMTQIKIAGAVVWTYMYDAANRLVHVKDGIGTISADYYYDPFGRRLWKEVGENRTYFFYSDEGLIGEYDASGDEIKTYGYKPDSTWTTDPLFLKQNSEYYFYQNDHLGTPQKLVAVNGAVVWSAQYSSFGEANVQVETVINNLRFPGQFFDDETGLHYNFQRYYDPRIGRYLRVDPIGLQEEANPFAYSKNNPVNFYDARGLYPCSPWHGTMISPSKSVWLISHLQEEADKYLDFKIREASSSFWYSLLADPPHLLSYTRNINRLDFISGIPGIKPGKGVIRHTQTNKFVYTCKYGWVDHGHFFYNAYGTYLAGSWVTAFLAELNEIKQTLTGSDSAYSPEDKTSNWLGRQFGRRMYEYDHIHLRRDIAPASVFFDIAHEWEQFLKDAGAVKWEMIDAIGMHVKDLLDSECERFLELRGPGTMLLGGSTVLANQFYKQLQPEWRCLCDGDVPRYEELRF